jgi:hypothetical protein
MDNQDKDFFDDADSVPDIKPKKTIKQAKLQHLANIRVKALGEKKEMKQMKEKANELIKIESLNEAKKIQK